MRPDVRRDPDELDRAAARLRALAADLHEAAVPSSTGHHGTLAGRIVHELAALADTATRSAAVARRADRSAADGFRGLLP
ncbi:hypothetical protein WIS52_08980 [Pseudonocardia nematodicida]|uniref:Uncharacterized protein n=1 Tax=Pseudonocardia nematodicida TaxID=1206997 RepID=A0ABV1K7Y9_9PSEU